MADATPPRDRRPPAWWPVEGDEPDPRWSLANERTLLAYNRTALAFLVAGLAVAGSRDAADTSVVFALMGIPLLVLSGAIAWAGRRRFLSAQRAMRMHEPFAAPVVAAWLPVATALVAAACVVVAAFEIAG